MKEKIAQRIVDRRELDQMSELSDLNVDDRRAEAILAEIKARRDLLQEIQEINAPKYPDNIGTLGVFGPHPAGQRDDGALTRIIESGSGSIGCMDANIAITANAAGVFRDCTGKFPHEAIEAWRLFCEGLLLAVVPSRLPKVRECLDRLDSIPADENRVALLEMLRTEAKVKEMTAAFKVILTGAPLELRVPDEEGRAPGLLVRSIAGLDRRFEALSAEYVLSAQKKHQRSVHALAARLSLKCGAFGDARTTDSRGKVIESESKALNRIANAFRAAEKRLGCKIKRSEV